MYGLNGYSPLYNNTYLVVIVPDFMGRAAAWCGAWQAVRRAIHTAAP
jgi:hypothetical protein